MLAIMENNLNIESEEGIIEDDYYKWYAKKQKQAKKLQPFFDFLQEIGRIGKFKPIRSTAWKNHDVLRNIQKMYVPKGFDLDPTYSKGVFYKPDDIMEPRLKYDLFPKTKDIMQASAESLPLEDGSIGSIMFDPPFVAGHTRKKVGPTGVIGERYHGFRYVSDLWGWYDECLAEFSRVLEDKGILVFKCQDTVSSAKNWFSHCFIMNRALVHGFYPRDMFVLLAKARIPGHNHRKKQSHARKFHSYFWVFEKKKCRVPYDIEEIVKINQAADERFAKREKEENE